MSVPARQNGPFLALSLGKLGQHFWLVEGVSLCGLRFLQKRCVARGEQSHSYHQCSPRIGGLVAAPDPQRRFRGDGGRNDHRGVGCPHSVEDYQSRRWQRHDGRQAGKDGVQPLGRTGGCEFHAQASRAARAMSRPTASSEPTTRGRAAA